MTNKVCTVIGVGPGLGLSIARRFAREGYAISLLARRAQALDEYVTELRREGIMTAGFAADVADDEALKAALAQSKKQLGATEVLVYNAAVLQQGLPTLLNSAKLVSDFKVNVAAALVATHDVLTDMRDAGQGTIVFTGGGLALHPAATYTSLSLGKAAIRSLAYSLGEELEPQGIHVATVTIQGFIQPGNDRYDPDLVAENYWQLHVQPRDQWTREIPY